MGVGYEALFGIFGQGIENVYEDKWDKNIQDRILSDCTHERNMHQEKSLRYPLNKTHVYMALSIRNKIFKEQKHVFCIRWVILIGLLVLLSILLITLFVCIAFGKVYETLGVLVTIIVEIIGLFKIITKYIFAEYINNDYQILGQLVNVISEMNFKHEDIDYQDRMNLANKKDREAYHPVVSYSVYGEEMI